MNGFSTEEDSRDGPPPPSAPFLGQTCCLIDGGERCARAAGNASFRKRVQKSISQKRLKLDIDKTELKLLWLDRVQTTDMAIKDQEMSSLALPPPHAITEPS